MVKHDVWWGLNVPRTHRNGVKWLTKVKQMQNLWQFKSLCPCQNRKFTVNSVNFRFFINMLGLHYEQNQKGLLGLRFQ